VHGCNAPDAAAMLHRNKNQRETGAISTILKSGQRNR
jgi:hypothetical protein